MASIRRTPAQSAPSGLNSEDVLAAAAAHLAGGGLDPSAVVPAAAHFESRDEIERGAVRAT
eukprot:5427296-Alexandrium_andersonii.AAC.1